MSNIKQIDLCLIADTTGSMGSFIHEAQLQFSNMVRQIGINNDVDFNVALVEYRDHPPEDHSFVTRVFQFTNINDIQSAISKMDAAGGGDCPEAVYDGVMDAAKKLTWRENSVKIMFLVGDAYPHAMNAHDMNGEDKKRSSLMTDDKWANGTPSNVNLHDCTAAAEELGITIYSVVVSQDPITTMAFDEISALTGGSSSQGYIGSINKIQSYLNIEISDMELQERIMAASSDIGSDDLEKISSYIGESYHTTTRAAYKLMSRGYNL